MAVKQDKSNYTKETINIWFRDQVEPEQDSEEFIPYWKREKDRCINGFTIANEQVYIPGWLYWHTVYWTIELDKEIVNPITGKKTSYKTPGTPTFRDIEWEIGNDFEECERQQKHLCLVGARRFGKSMISSSFLAHGYTFFRDSEFLSTGGNHPDIAKLNEKIEFGLSNLHPVFFKQRLKSNWKLEVRAGWTDKTTGLSKGSNSRIIIRNYDNGNNTMATNGTAPKRQVIDEIGKVPGLVKCVEDSVPSWQNDYGVFCVTMLCGCVCAGTKVWTHDGRLVNIEDLKQEDGIIGYNGNSFSKETISNMNPISKKNCYKITTSGNNILECSEDHPLLVSNRNKRTSIGLDKNVNQYSFKQTKDLQLGDFISRIYEVPIFGNEVHTNARLLGLFLADGYFKGSSLSIDDIKIREFVTNNYETSIRKEFLTKKGELYSDLYLKGVKDIFDKYKLTSLVKECKKLPDNIHLFDKISLSEILAGIFDGDGNIYYNPKNHSTRIVLTNISFKLLEDVKYQLLKFGIQSAIYKEKRNTIPSEEYKGQKDHIYRLYIAKDKSVQRFKDNIPILHSKKVETLNTLFRRGNRDYGYHKGVFKLTGEHNDETFLENNTLLSGFTFESITKIEYIGEKEIYNLTALENHTYLANGFITHNTGGDMETGEDAGTIFNSPEVYNILSFTDPHTGTKTGKFISALKARNEYKEKWTLYKYLKDKFPEKYQDLELHKDLNIEILVSNEAKCLEEFIKPRREKANKSTSSNTIIKEKAYFPITSQECFLVVSSNDFPVEACKEQLDFLNRINFQTQKVELYTDLNGTIQFKHTDRKPVSDFPVTAKSDKTGVIEIIEHPVINAQFGLYVASLDPYKAAESDYSDSLGSLYIYKRGTTNMYEPFQNMPIAWYHGRPGQIKEFYENVRLLLEYYGASLMSENADAGFIDYMIGLNKQHYLAKGQSFLKEIAPTSKHKGEYGLPPTPKTIKHWNDAAVIYTKELFDKVSQEDGTKKEQLGVTRILDRMLLTEMIKFNKNSGNFDRCRSFGILVAYANQLDGQIGKIAIEEEYREKTKYIKSPFAVNNISSRENSRYSNKVNSPFLINKIR